MREIAAEERSRSEAAAKKDRIEKDIARVQRQTYRSRVRGLGRGRARGGDGANLQDEAREYPSCARQLAVMTHTCLHCLLANNSALVAGRVARAFDSYWNHSQPSSRCVDLSLASLLWKPLTLNYPKTESPREASLGLGNRRVRHCRPAEASLSQGQLTTTS